jgi:RNA polymerase sigma factor (sigma-70 family)
VKKEPTVFLVDDDPSVLRALARLMRSAGYAVQTFASPKEFLEHRAESGPGCIVVDLCMPEMSGLELQDVVARSREPLPVIFLTGQGDIPTTVQAMKAGAMDFLTKPVDDRALLDVIARALAREIELRAALADQKAIESRFDSLTPREREVCVLVAQGLMNKEIAFQLGTSEKTIKVHRARVMEKLAVGSVAELVRIADRWLARGAREQ